MNHADDVRTKERRAYAVPHVLETRMALYRFFIGSSRTGEVIRHFEGFDGMRVLDLGCGNGELAHEMLQTFPHAHIVGIDTSEPLLEQARIRCVNQSAEFIVNDASSVTLDGLFDRILLAHTLHLMADKPAMLAHALRHVTSGGRCVLTLHSSQDVPRKRGWIAWFEQMFHKKYCGSRESLTIESWDEVMGDEFVPSVRETVAGVIRLTESAPYLAYLQTERARFEPAPTDEEWNTFIFHAQQDMESDIERQGFFDESHAFGMIVLVKT